MVICLGTFSMLVSPSAAFATEKTTTQTGDMTALSNTELASYDEIIDNVLNGLQAGSTSNVIGWRGPNVGHFNEDLDAPGFIDPSDIVSTEVSQKMFSFSNLNCTSETPIKITVEPTTFTFENTDVPGVDAYGGAGIGIANIDTNTIGQLDSPNSAFSQVGDQFTTPEIILDTTVGELTKYRLMIAANVVTNNGNGGLSQIQIGATNQSITYTYDDATCLEPQESPTPLDSSSQLDTSVKGLTETIPNTGLTELNNLLVSAGLILILFGYALTRANKTTWKNS